MSKPHEDDVADGELGELLPVADPVRVAFAAAIGEVMAVLPDGNARRVVVTEIMEAHTRVTTALAAFRRTLN